MEALRKWVRTEDESKSGCGQKVNLQNGWRWGHNLFLHEGLRQRYGTELHTQQ